MEHAIQLPRLTIGSLVSHPQYLEPIDPPQMPFCSPQWCLQQKPRFVSLLDVYKNHELLTTYQVDQKSVYLIGRHAVACDIVLEHCSISRLHASIIHHQAGCTYLVDLGSCHGTFVDEMPLQALRPTLIVHGSVLKFGLSSRLYFFKSFESREQITEIVHSRIGLDQEEMELQKNTMLNRAISYRLGLSPVQPEHPPSSDGNGSDEPMPDALEASAVTVSMDDEDLVIQPSSDDQVCDVQMVSHNGNGGRASGGENPDCAVGAPTSILCLNRKRARPSSATSFGADTACVNGTSSVVDLNDVNTSLITSREMRDSTRSLEPKRVHFSAEPPDIIVHVASPTSPNGETGSNRQEMMSVAVPMVLDSDSDGGSNEMNTGSDDDAMVIQPTTPGLSIQPTTPGASMQPTTPFGLTPIRALTSAND